MTNVERIEHEIEALSPEEFAQIREWVLERDGRAWDEQIECDIAAGKLDGLADEAVSDYRAGRTKLL